MDKYIINKYILASKFGLKLFLLVSKYPQSRYKIYQTFHLKPFHRLSNP